MSRVFVAREEALGRDVVVKVLAPELAAGVTGDGLPWFTMPFVDGESLRARLARGSIPLGEAMKVLGDVARALAYAHGRRIVHRDIEPENVLLSSGTAAVLDFGIAKALQRARERWRPTGRPPRRVSRSSARR